MLKTFISLLTVVIFLSQHNKKLTPFEKAEKLFLEGYISGNRSQWAIADSIFLTLEQTNQFDSKTQKLKAEIYQVQIHQQSLNYSSDPEKLQQSLEVLRRLNNEHHQLIKHDKDFYLQLKHFQFRINLFQGKEDAVENLKQLAKVFDGNPSIEPTSLATLYETISRHYYAKSRDFAQSKKYGLKALNLFTKSPWKYKQINMNQWIGGNYYNLDQIDSAIYHMTNAYDSLKTLSNNQQNVLVSRSELAFNLGVIYQGKIANMHESEHFLKEAIEWEIKANGQESLTLITYYSLLSDTFYFIKDIENAELYGHKAYTLAHEVLKTENVYLRSLPAMALSRINVQKSDFIQARKLIDKVLEESLNFYGKNDKFTTQAFIDKAYVEENAGEYDEAEKYYLLAVQSAEATQRIYSIQSAYNHLTSMYLNQKEYQKALPYALLTLDLSNVHLAEDYKIKAIENLTLAKVYLGLNELDNAKKHLQQAEKTLAKNSNTQLLDTEALALKNAILFKEYQSSKDLSLLDKAFENIHALIEQLIQGKSTYNYQNSKLFYSQSIAPHIENALEIATEKHQLSPNNTTINTIFQLMELNKSSVLLDGILDTEIKAKKDVPQSILDDEKNLNQRISSLNHEIYKAENDSTFSVTQLNEILNERTQLNKELKKIAQFLQQKHPMYYEAKNMLLSEDLAHYQKNALLPGQAFLEYYISEEKIYRLLITPSKIEWEVLDDATNIDQTTDKLLHLLIERKELSETANDLAKQILPQIPDEINELIVISDKKLTQIPFEMLEIDGKLLLEKMNVSYAGSVQLYLVQKKLAMDKKNSKYWTGFAPAYKTNQLPNNQTEVQHISELTNGNTIIGAAATKNKFLEEAPKAAVLHLATHSEFDPINPMLSKMYFYDGEDSGELTASEVYNLDLNAKLVVLSACNTGLGKIESGDGVMSISRAFTYAGVSSTIMSLWKVSDKETSDLMVYFYKNLNQSQSKNEALRNAKLEYLQNTQETELKHPYYWAGFVISGDVTPIHEKQNKTWIYSLILLTLIGICWGIYRFKAARSKP